MHGQGYRVGLPPLWGTHPIDKSSGPFEHYPILLEIKQAQTWTSAHSISHGATEL